MHVVVIKNEIFVMVFNMYNIHVYACIFAMIFYAMYMYIAYMEH